MVKRMRLIGCVLLLLFIGPVLGMSSVVAAPPQQTPTVHIVQPGETLSAIAYQYGVSLESLMQANFIRNPEYIYAGQRLVIPGVTSAATSNVGTRAAQSAQVAVAYAPQQTTAVSAPSSSVAATSRNVYVVQPGDTLSAIALRYNTTIGAIAEANGISPWRDIYPGQRLIIPGANIPETPAQQVSAPAAQSSPANTTTVYIVQAGDTLSGIATRYGLTVTELAAANGLTSSDYIYIGQRLTIPRRSVSSSSSAVAAPPTPSRYVVQPGDTMSLIAAKTGADMWLIARVNDIQDVSTIYPGQVLKIPRIVPPRNPPWGPKRIEIDISAQRMFVWEGDVLVNYFVISTGYGAYQTRRGRFPIKSKIPMAYSSAYDLDMPYWLGIYDVGRFENGIHGLPTKRSTGRQIWEGVLGSPVSFGCAVLSVPDAKWLFDWAELGTPVVIFD